jgi:hypothetical protein
MCAAISSMVSVAKGTPARSLTQGATNSSWWPAKQDSQWRRVLDSSQAFLSMPVQSDPVHAVVEGEAVVQGVIVRHTCVLTVTKLAAAKPAAAQPLLKQAPMTAFAQKMTVEEQQQSHGVALKALTPSCATACSGNTPSEADTSFEQGQLEWAQRMKRKHEPNSELAGLMKSTINMKPADTKREHHTPSQWKQVHWVPEHKREMFLADVGNEKLAAVEDDDIDADDSID